MYDDGALYSIIKTCLKIFIKRALFFTFKILNNKVKILSKETSAFEIDIDLIKKLIKF
jgi:hypothetical protein